MVDREAVLAAAVRARRKELGLRQEELADLAGVSERFIFAVESGKASVRLDKLMDLLAAMGLHLQLHRGHAEGVQAGAGVDG